jgi:adenylate kinase family enzyme
VSVKIDAILLIGPTGAGKSPLGDHIERHGLAGRRCHHFDFGQQLRTLAAENDPPEEFTAKEHIFIRDVLEKAMLLERRHFPIAEKIVSSFLRRKRYDKGDMIVLNGLPRHVEQALDMDQIISVHSLILLDCPADVANQRIRKNTGGDRTDRDDDNIALIEKKLGIFRDRTAPLIDHYSGRRCRIVRIAVRGDSSAADLYADLIQLVNEHSMR